MNLLDRFLERTEFDGYDDFIENYKLLIPENFNFGYDVIDEYARLEPDKAALLRYDDLNEYHYSFGDISRLSNKTANFFRSRGLKKGDCIMLMLRERAEAWTCMIAAIKLGVIVIPATFQLTAEDIVYRSECASLKMICTVDENERIVQITKALPQCGADMQVAVVGENIPEGWLNLRVEVEKAPDSLDRITGSNDDTMLIYFSSGTTGLPKMVAHDFTYPLGHITTAVYWQQVRDGGRHLTYSDSGWAKFAWGKIFGQWIAGSVIVAYDTNRFKADKLLEAINRLRLTTFCAPPTVLRSMIAEDMSGCDFSTLRHCCSAGEPLNPEVISRFREASGLTIHEGFGQTETSVLLANFGWEPIKAGSMGKPAPMYDIKLIDSDGNECEDGVIGSIVINNAGANRPCGLFAEYRNNPEAMAESFTGGVYNTKDMAWRDSDGYFWFEGRDDDIIKCSGYRIGPFEVESVLLTHPAVMECAVTAVPDDIRGQVVKATIILNRGYEASEELKKTLQDYTKNNTAPYKYPRVIEFVSELPKTSSGKIKRSEIKKHDAQKRIIN
ncbi:MAG: AMP-binding protein [Eubacteriales bacterium]|jgi:acetyl-CoA synthetase|nr:AMP-binding protein [Eubacteriales bacterium]